MSNIKLDEAKVREIRSRHHAGESEGALATAFDVTPMTINQVVRRVTWRDVEDAVSVSTAVAVQSDRLNLADGEVTVVARNAEELEVAQQGLMAWCDRKKESTAAELQKILDNIQISVDNGWQVDALSSVESKLKKQAVFYEKLRRAFELGYHIVPNMPCTVFAVRTDRQKPPQAIVENSSAWNNNARPVRPQLLTEGEGRYVGPNPLQHAWTDVEKRDSQEVKHYFAQAGDFDEVDFPFKLAATRVLSDTAAAMALRLFDEIAEVPQSRAAGDPMVIGRFRKPGTDRVISFLITWYVDTRDL